MSAPTPTPPAGAPTTPSAAAALGATLSPVARAAQARDIIREHVILCAGANTIPVPIAGSMAVTGVQLKMLAELSRLYGVPFSHDLGRALVASAAGGVLSFVLAQNPVTRSIRDFLMATVPVIAIPLRLLAGPALMAAYTLILGNAFVRHYETGGTYLNFNWQDFRFELASKLGLPLPSGT